MTVSTFPAKTNKEEIAAKKKERKKFDGLVQSSAKLLKYTLVIVKGEGGTGRNAIVHAKAYSAADAVRLAIGAEVNAGSIVAACFKGAIESVDFAS